MFSHRYNPHFLLTSLKEREKNKTFEKQKTFDLRRKNEFDFEEKCRSKPKIFSILNIQ